MVTELLHTSCIALQSESSTEFISSLLQTIKLIIIDMLAAIARKDYENRCNCQM